MKRRERSPPRMKAASRALSMRGLSLGVEDVTRQGALRYRRPGEQAFLAHETLTVRQLQVFGSSRSWPARSPRSDRRSQSASSVAESARGSGCLLGWCRPKASYTETNGSLWIAKFPAPMTPVTWALGRHSCSSWPRARHRGASLRAAPLQRRIPHLLRTALRSFRGSTALLCLRNGPPPQGQSEGRVTLSSRSFYTRAELRITLRPTSNSYSGGWLQRRIGNRDDHLRNHGFLLTTTGWRLAPAFDLNPNTERADHVLNIDESDNRPSLATVIETSEWYVGSKDRGR